MEHDWAFVVDHEGAGRSDFSRGAAVAVSAVDPSLAAMHVRQLARHFSEDLGAASAKERQAVGGATWLPLLVVDPYLDVTVPDLAVKLALVPFRSTMLDHSRRGGLTANNAAMMCAIVQWHMERKHGVRIPTRRFVMWCQDIKRVTAASILACRAAAAAKAAELEAESLTYLTTIESREEAARDIVRRSLDHRSEPARFVRMLLCELHLADVDELTKKIRRFVDCKRTSEVQRVISVNAPVVHAAPAVAIGVVSFVRLVRNALRELLSVEAALRCGPHAAIALRKLLTDVFQHWAYTLPTDDISTLFLLSSSVYDTEPLQSSVQNVLTAVATVEPARKRTRKEYVCQYCGDASASATALARHESYAHRADAVHAALHIRPQAAQSMCEVEELVFRGRPTASIRDSESPTAAAVDAKTTVPLVGIAAALHANIDQVVTRSISSVTRAVGSSDNALAAVEMEPRGGFDAYEGDIELASLAEEEVVEWVAKDPSARAEVRSVLGH